jgi:GNAT superfamily N-acetyltransferase
MPLSTDVSSFAVHPDHQGKGIGTELLRHCMQIADEHRLPSWLQALPGSHSLYLRAGFVDVVHRDVDLNEWDGFKYRGHGLYRTYMMERQSRSVESGAP